ncbi:(2Fe-2S) ferredoxin domain-containing protein [Spirulina sp. CS-785/01]|uniref:(2Fe-2S) ferredoxin domain-containing protein n=1 Tax=Spirulina sp. CS-785/01 TaxID=3021716 RepID=UPI002330F7C3|nr:(2Fe-2S) ferredoxin domain-containing protein [Spirulina sp. CS-785/01]MDB9314037.1 (2Fe-2S) ferredoxin domain-containing protein [Spirulina sp. CS-785/01]
MKAQQFEVSGQLLDFVIKGGVKIKFLRLAAAEREYWIKVPKGVRLQLDGDIRPGCWLTVTGKRKLKKSGKLKLKAKSVNLWSPAEQVTHCSQPCSHQSIPVEIPEKTPNGTKSSQSSFSPSSKSSQKKGSPPAKILVCGKSKCQKRNGAGLCQALQRELSDRGLDTQVQVKTTGCLKKCKKGPNAVVLPDKTHYMELHPVKVPKLIEKHFS